MQDTITVELPITKAIVTFKGFLTTGQSRELQKVLLARGDFDVTNTTNAMKSVDASAVLEMQDKAAAMLIAGIKNENGDQTFTQEWLDNLPMQDGNIVYEKINELIGSTATLSEEDKKK